MSNNIVELSGLLAITEVQSFPGVSQNSLVVQGWIETGPAYLGGRHAFIAIDQKARIILDYAREAGGRHSGPFQTDEALVGVSAHGKLLPIGKKSTLVVKHISFFDVSKPVAPCEMDDFYTNIVRMQGILSIPKGKTTGMIVGGFEYPFRIGELLTEKAGDNSGHRLIIPEEMACGLADEMQARGKKALEASLVGSLLSLNDTSFVKVKYLSLCQEAFAMNFLEVVSFACALEEKVCE
jgi:hypothetical protein